MNTTDPTSALADLQRRGLRNALAFGRATTGMLERLARQNYAVMGDVVDYAITQLRIPTVHTDPRGALEARAAGTRAAVETARVRATEYAAIVGELRGVVDGAAGSADAVPSKGSAGAAGGSPIVVSGDSPASVAREQATPVVPVAKAVAKRPAAKKDAAPKAATAKRQVGKKTVAKKTVAKKGTAKNTAAKKATAKSTAAKKASKKTTPARGSRTSKGKG